MALLFNIPPVSSKVVNPDGSISREWFLFFSTILQTLGGPPVQGGITPLGTVANVSVASANGFGGTVATSTTTPVISLTTSITGILYGNGTGLYAAIPANFPILNQSTTGNAATATNVAYSGLTGTVPTWNQNTTGNAATATLAVNTTGNSGSATSLQGGSSGSLPYQIGANNTSFLPIGTNAQVMSIIGGLPSWATPTTGTGNLVFATSPTISKPSFDHIIGNSTTPTIAAGSGAGTSPTLSIVGTDLGFTVTVISGTLPTAAAVIATITFASSYGSAPHAVFSAGNSATALLSGTTMIYSTTTTSTFVMTAGTAALVAATTYVWNVILIQ